MQDLEHRLTAASREISEGEKRVLRHWKDRLHIARDTNREFRESMSLGDRVADRVAAFGGSWTFIFCAVGGLIFWIILNTIFLLRAGQKAFDPYPFILLNLLLSMTAALQAPVIMMSQNRQAAKDRMEASHDYEVNLKAEMEILSLHAKLDSLRDDQWRELIELQKMQLQLLSQLCEGHVPQTAPNPPGD